MQCCRVRSGRHPLTSNLLFAAALTVALGAASSGSVLAQESRPVGERSPLVAALLQAALPPLPLGYIYAQDLGRALLPTTLMVGGSVAFVLGTVEIIDWTNENRSPVLLYTGFGAMLVGYVYGIVDAADATRDRNTRLGRASVTIDAPPSQGLISIRISLRPG